MADPNITHLEAFLDFQSNHSEMFKDFNAASDTTIEAVEKGMNKAISGLRGVGTKTVETFKSVAKSLGLYKSDIEEIRADNLKEPLSGFQDKDMKLIKEFNEELQNVIKNVDLKNKGHNLQNKLLTTDRDLISDQSDQITNINKLIDDQTKMLATDRDLISDQSGHVADINQFMNSQAKILSTISKLISGQAAYTNNINQSMSSQSKTLGINNKLISGQAGHANNINQSINNQNKALKINNNLLSSQAGHVDDVNQLMNNQNRAMRDSLELNKKAYNLAWMVLDAIWAADQATQNFITTNFRLYGSQYELTQQSLELAAATGQTADKAIEAVAALSNLATPKEQMKDLSETILQANTYLGVGIAELAEFSRQNRFAGGDVKSFNRMIGYSADAMKTYGLNSSDVGKILGDTNVSMFDLYMSMGQFGTRTKDEAGKFLTSMELMKKAQLSFEGMAKRMGYAAGTGANAIAALADPKKSGYVRAMAESMGLAINGAEDLLASLPAVTSGFMESANISLDMIKAYKSGAMEGTALSGYVESLMAQTGLAKDQILLMLEVADEMKAAGKDVRDFAQVEAYMKAKNAAEAYKEAMSTLTGQVGLIVNKLNAFANMINVVIGQGLMEWMQELQPLFDIITESISSVVKGIKEFAAKNPGLAKTIRMAASAILFLVVALTTYSMVSKMATMANTLLSFSFKMSPIGMFITLVIALAVGLVYLYENFEDVRFVVDKLNNYFHYLKENVKSFIEMIQPAIDKLGNTFHYFKENLSGANGTLAMFASIISTIAIGAFIVRVSRIRKVFSSFKDWISPGEKAIDQFSAFTNKKGGEVTGIFGRIGQALKSVFTAIVDGIIFVIGKLGDLLKAVFDALAKVAEGISKVIKNLVKDITFKDIAVYIGLGIAFYIIAKAATVFANAAKIVADNLGPMLVAMAALVLVIGLLGFTIVTLGKMAQGSFVGIAIVIGALFALSLIALILANAMEILAPPLNSVIKTLSESSGSNILGSGLALAVALSVLGAVGLAVFVPLLLLSGALTAFSGALSIFGSVTKSIMPQIEMFEKFVKDVLASVFDVMTKAIEAAERVIFKIVDSLSAMFIQLALMTSLDPMALVGLGAAIFAFSVEGGLAAPGLIALSTALSYLEPKITSMVQTMQKYAALPPGLMMSMVNDFAAASSLMDSVGTTIKGAFSAAGAAIAGLFGSSEPVDMFNQINMLSQIGLALKTASLSIMDGSKNLAVAAAVLAESGFLQIMDQIKSFASVISSGVNIAPFIASMGVLAFSLSAIAPNMLAAGDSLEKSTAQIISPIDSITAAIQKLNEAILDLANNSLTNLSRLGPALQGVFEKGIGPVNAETINNVQMTTESDGGTFDTPDKKDPMKMVIAKLDAMKKQDHEYNTKMLGLMDAQLSEMRNRSNISTSYNAWVS